MGKKTKKTQQNGHTVFHRTKEFLNERYELYENIINNKFYIRSLENENSEFELINENNLYIEINEFGISITFEKLFAILKSDFTPKINPIQQYFEKLPEWDKKTDHIKNFTSYIKAIDQDWFYTQLKKWLVRVIKCVLNDGYFNKQAFIFAQQGQNSGKTTLCRFFCPTQLNEYKKENISNLTSKDTKIEISRNFLINIDELAIMHKVDDMKSLKSLMTTDYINERLPYARSNVVLPRRCSFIGSTDNFDFLKDKTGNVRWLVIELESSEKPINYEYSKKININDLWSQAYYLSKDEKFQFEMTTEEIRKNELNNEKYFVPNIETDIIKRTLKPGTKINGEFMIATDILEYLKQDNPLNYSLLSKTKPEHIGRALTQLGFKKTSSTYNKNDNVQTWNGYYVIKLEKDSPF